MRGFKELYLVLLVVAVTIDAARDRNKKKYKVVCYLGNWANNRTGDGRFLIEHIDPNLCTHVIYGFAKLVNNKIADYDFYSELKENWGLDALPRFNSLRDQNPQLSTLIAIGGWNEGSTNYSKMASTVDSRAIFVQSVINFCKIYRFDGLDMDWQYPANRGGALEDRKNFVILLKELREALEKEDLLLTAAVSADKNTMDTAYDISMFARFLDFINVMAYDFHGSWEKTAGHNAPLYARVEEPESDKILNVDYAIQYWVSKGAPKEKVVLGMGTYGRSFTLANAANHDLGAPTTGPGSAGPMTKEPGMLGYNEICLKVKEGSFKEVFVWNVEAPYAHEGNLWVGYDNKRSIEAKVDYIIQHNLGGGMIWSLETDDFRGKCHGEKYPLLTVIAAKLNGIVTTEKPEENTTAHPSQLFKCTSDGYHHDPNDCSTFYLCISKGGREFERQTYNCRENLVFDEKIKACNFRDQVPGC